MDYVSDEEFKEIRDRFHYAVVNVREHIQTIVNGINRGSEELYYLRRGEIQKIMEDASSNIRLLKNTRRFSQEQLDILAQYENEIKGFETSINNAYGQRDQKARLEKAKMAYDMAMNGGGLSNWTGWDYDLNSTVYDAVLNKKYVKGSSLYKYLCDMIEACSKFQRSEDWNLIDSEKQQNVNNRLQRLLQKQAEVVRISADVLSYKGKIILLAASVVLAVIASIQGLEWCCITVPLAYYYVFKILLPHQTQKNVDITIFAVYAAMMLSIIIPIKWSSVAIIPLAIFGYWYIKSNKDLIGQEEQKQ